MKYTAKNTETGKTRAFSSLEQLVKWGKRQGISAEKFSLYYDVSDDGVVISQWEYLDCRKLSGKELAILEEMAQDRAFEYFEADEDELIDNIKSNLEIDKSLVWKKFNNE